MPIKSSSSSYFASSSLLLLSAAGERDSERKRKFTGKTTSMQPPPQPLSLSPTIPTTCLLRFEIGDFARHSHPKGSYVETRSIQISNRSWKLKVYPRGHERSRSDKVLVSCFLVVDGGDGSDEQPQDESLSSSSSSSSSSSLSLSSDFEFALRIQNWRMVPRRCELRSDVAYGFMGHTREKILQQGLDEDGTLVVDVTLKFWSQPPQKTTVWYPNKKCKQKYNDNASYYNKNMGGQLFRSQEFADISYLVDKTVFRAHKCVLAVRARPLLELALHNGNNNNNSNNSSNNNNNNNEPIEIPNVEEGVFRVFLDYLYTSSEENLLRFLETHDDDDNKNISAAAVAESLLVVADKFGATDLKVLVESVLADKFLSEANCFQMLLLADSHWCALLKEEAMRLYCSDPMASIRGSKNGWNLLQESPKLLSELLFRSAQQQVDRGKPTRGTKSINNHNNNRFLQDLSVGALRDRLEEAGLDPDGSKEMLVRRVASLEGPSPSPLLAQFCFAHIK